MSKKLSVITISITPFDAAGQLDEAAFRQHIRRLRDGGVSVFVGGSGSGEGYTLTPEENDRILAIAVEELKGNEGNIAPSLAASVITAFQAKDLERLRDSFGKLMGLAEIVKRYGGATLRGLKPLLNAFGLPGGTLREPWLPIDAADLDTMIKAVLALQIPELPPLPKRA